MKKHTSKMATAVCVAGLLCNSTSAFAVTQSVTANITFEAALTLTKNADINIGAVTALQANTYTIDTAGAISVTGAGTGVSIGGTISAGDITIIGSTTQTISITDGNYSAAAGGVSAVTSSATCKYGAAAAVDCTGLAAQAAPGAGTTLLIGVAVSADGTQAAGSTAAPTFDIIVNYS